MNQPDVFGLLRIALRSNAVFSSLSGVLFVAASVPVANYVGGIRPLDVLSIGLCLLGFAGLLVWLATRNPVPRTWVLAVIAMDAAWVVGTGLVCLVDLLSTQGKIAALGVAVVVAVLAALQWIGLARAGAAPAAVSG